MKSTVCWILLCLAFLTSNAVAEHPLQASLASNTPIPANSENAYEFRGNASFSYEPYEALFEAKTYGELRTALEEFFRRWKEDDRVFEDSSSKNMFYHCRLALIRTYYLLGDTGKADTILTWMHPAFELDETGFSLDR